MKTIFLDFNRTIFDPEINALIDGVHEALIELKKLGYRLILIAMNENSRRNRIEELGIDHFFDSIYLVDIKDDKLFREIVEKENIDLREILIVGDRVRDEIAIGRRIGSTTIWLRRGKFADILPESKELHPHFVVRDWCSAMKIIRGIA